MLQWHNMTAVTLNNKKWSNVWLTSDCHWFHTNVLKYCNRPFSDVLEMNERLIEQHNKVVKPNDIVYNLGDFSFQKIKDAVSILKKLNGRHRFIRGNHDQWLEDDEKTGTTAIRLVHDELLRQGCEKSKVEWIKDYYEFKDNGQLYCLSHYCMFVYRHSYKGAIQFYGHSHSNIEHLIKGRQMDVGVDNAAKILGDYRPFNLTEATQILLKRPIATPELQHITDNPWDKSVSNLK